MTSPNTGRRGSVWRRIRAQVLAGNPYCFCGEPINTALPAGHRLSATVDHITPLHLGGDPLARSNLRPAHRACNSARRQDGGGTTRPPEVYVPTLPQPGPAPWH